MTEIKTKILIAADGTLTGRLRGVPPGEHETEIALLERTDVAHSLDVVILLARVRAIQDAIARLPVIDTPSPDEIVGYDAGAHFD